LGVERLEAQYMSNFLIGFIISAISFIIGFAVAVLVLRLALQASKIQVDEFKEKDSVW